ncbi:hypothetical protein [Pseudomonas syringae]|uniref:hypothetical protein n=1 Tax=Pseudomonas syringae TaxID=317 RepID=UPI0009B17610|nr:hypothetical protein [Pseudomonas syringae]AYL84412.1 hypothetical protein CN228_32650 [Pseudomonas syringae pv. actinidiae str. Shaanxi_M228]
MNAIATPVMGFITCTEPLQAKGNGHDYPILVRIEFERQPDDSVQLISRGGHTGTLITNARRVNISSHDWDNRPYDPLDSLVLNRWAFSKAGWVLRDNE